MMILQLLCEDKKTSPHPSASTNPHYNQHYLQRLLSIGAHNACKGYMKMLQMTKSFFQPLCFSIIYFIMIKSEDYTTSSLVNKNRT